MRWMREIHEVQNRQQRSAKFHDLVSFVDRAAEDVTDAVYSGLLTAGRGAARSHQPTEAVAANISTSPLQGQGGCVVCSGSHSVAYCEQFKGLDLGSRAKFARQKGLCFNCLKRGHKAESCTVAKRCPISGCGRKHSPLLHKPSPAATQVRAEAEETCLATGAGAGLRVSLPIVPVQVRVKGSEHSVLTCALLDSGSTNSFCCKELTELLGVKGQKEVFTLTTLGRADSMEEAQVV